MNKNYVYVHLDNGEPVYVGVGKGGRAWNSDARQQDHQSWMMDRLPEQLKIQWVATGISKPEAISLERQLVYELSPKFNKIIPIIKHQWKVHDRRHYFKKRRELM